MSKTKKMVRPIEDVQGEPIVTDLAIASETQLADEVAEIQQALVPGGDPFMDMVERVANNPDIDAEKMQKLVDIQVQIMGINAEREYNEAFARVQQQLPTVLADAENQQTHSTYAKHETIAKAIKPIYSAEGFSTSFTQGACERPDHVRIDGVLRHSGGHLTMHWVELPVDDKGIKGNVNKTPLHAAGSTFTYGRRYLTCLMFDVATGDDTDGNVYEPEVTISEERIADLYAVAEEWFADRRDHALQSLARRRFQIADGNWHNIPAWRFNEAVQSLRDKGEEMMRNAKQNSA